MQPNHLDLLGSNREQAHDSRTQITRDNGSPSQEPILRSRNASGVRPPRSEDSWIEVSSQPSSSSLSSAATTDDIVTTGLRIQTQRQRRRTAPAPGAVLGVAGDPSLRPTSGHGSSQDEYEESESESDRVLSSSNEDVAARPLGDNAFLQMSSSTSEDMLSSDEDDNSTALGFAPNPVPFVPQPNAFSHPPMSQTHMRSREGGLGRAYSSRPTFGSSTRRNSRSSLRSTRGPRQQQQQQHSPYNMYSPSYQADHDAALRQSLSTLLSCAAAARGLPKNDTQPLTPGRPENNAPEPSPSTFRLVPESIAMADDGKDDSDQRVPPPTGPGQTLGAELRTQKPLTATTPSSKRSPSPSNASRKIRRKASSSKDRSTSQHASKRARRAALAESSSIVSPTVMTWVISAGVVVLFSAISFSAGYVLGREVGRVEAGQGICGNGMGNLAGGDGGIKAGAGCGKEAVKGGLKRFRWIGGGSGSGISV